MPINVQYQPVEAIGQAALAAGLGQFRQRQQEILLRQQAQQQQQDLAYAQMRQQAVQQANQLQAHRENSYLNAQQDAARLNQNAFFQDRAQQLQYLGLERDQQRLQFQDTQADEQRQHQLDFLQAQRDAMWQENAVKDAEDQIGTVSAEISKKSRFLTPEGRQSWMKLSGDLRAIQAQRANLRPQQYSKLLGEWQQEFNRSGIQKHISEPPPVSDQWKQAAVEVAPGYFVAQQPDGKWMDIDTRASGAGKLGAGQPSYMKDAASLGDALDKIKKSQPDKYQGDGVTPVVMSDEEALKILKERESLFQREAAAKQQPMPGGLPSLGQYDQAIQAFQAKAMQDGVLSEEEKQHLANLVQDRSELASGNLPKPPQQRIGPQNTDTMSVNARSPQTPSGAMIAAPTAAPAIKVDHLNDAPKALVDKFMPRPKSKKEFDALPIGTMFVSPDGSLRRK